jgi:site-specific DNA-methyltransferase (adenine-specific)
MKFDVIVGNPPYQLADGGNGASARPIYHLFVEQAKKLQPRYLTMIIPARWYAGGKGLDEFRKQMLLDGHVTNLVDFFDAEDCFPGVDISGGVCYFLWERERQDDCVITTWINGEPNRMKRPLVVKPFGNFIRFNQAISIVEKVIKNDFKSLMDIVSSRKPFGFDTSKKGRQSPFPNSVKLYTNKNTSSGVEYVDVKEVSCFENLVNTHKVFISRAYGERDEFPYRVIGTPFYGEPNSCCTETYLFIGPYRSKNNVYNAMSYLKTRFVRFLVLLIKNTQDAPKRVYQFVPMQDFSKPWTDEELYKKYNLTADEIKFIESMIKPME